MELAHAIVQELTPSITSSPRLEPPPEIEGLDDPEYLQNLAEFADYPGELDPDHFSSVPGWWYACNVCGGRTYLRSPHAYCRHCGFSQRSL